MYSSARRSSSSIEIPGRSSSPIIVSVSTTISPARAIPSISCCDLRRITEGRPSSESCSLAAKSPPRKDARSGRHPRTRSVRLRTPRGGALQRPSECEAGGGRPSPNRHLLQRGLDLGEDLVRRSVRVDRDEDAQGAVVLDQRLRLAVVELEPRADRLGRIVRPLFLAGAPEQPLD